MRLQQGAATPPPPRGGAGGTRPDALGNKGAKETNLSGGFSALNFFFHQKTCSDASGWNSSTTFRAGWMRRVALAAARAWASGHGLGLQHDDVQVGESLAVVNVFACEFSDLQEGSSSQRLHLCQEACAASLRVYLAQQELSVIVRDTDREFCSPRSIARLLSHLKV